MMGRREERGKSGKDVQEIIKEMEKELPTISKVGA